MNCVQTQQLTKSLQTWLCRCTPTSPAHTVTQNESHKVCVKRLGCILPAIHSAGPACHPGPLTTQHSVRTNRTKLFTTPLFAGGSGFMVLWCLGDGGAQGLPTLLMHPSKSSVTRIVRSVQTLILTVEQIKWYTDASQLTPGWRSWRQLRGAFGFDHSPCQALSPSWSA